MSLVHIATYTVIFSLCMSLLNPLQNALHQQMNFIERTPAPIIDEKLARACEQLRRDGKQGAIRWHSDSDTLWIGSHQWTAAGGLLLRDRQALAPAPSWKLKEIGGGVLIQIHGHVPRQVWLAYEH